MLKKIINKTELINKAEFIRNDLISICVNNGAGHIAPSLSTVEILVSLYYNILNLNKNPLWEQRDRLIFSKAHGCYALYSILCDIGYIERNDWENFYKNSFLSGCCERNPEHGIEATCGSLGHGLPMAVGIAFGAKLKKENYKVYCIAGDGELQEGSNWEAIQFAVKHELSNLFIIIDKNSLQAMDFLENILTPKNKLNDIEIKLKAFGTDVKTCNGHEISNILNCFEQWNNNLLINKPKALVAETIKGRGLKCMENVPKFHFRIPTSEELEIK